MTGDRFVLLVAPANGDSRSGGNGTDHALLPVDEGPAYVTWARNRTPRLVRADRRALLGRRPRLLVAPVRRHGADLLLLLVPGEKESVLCNGLPALPVNLLEVGDELRLGNATLFVSRQRGRRVDRAGSDRAGATCPVCRSPVGEQQRVYACGCGATLHCDGDEVAEDERLACADLASSCPNCRRHIEFEEGIEWTPQS